MIGQKLAHYTITELLGRGGMGEVYRAKDSKLGRDVALKILPREFSEDPERRARFEREARSLATLQHANIASVYDFEEVDGVRFLAMELVEGEELVAHIQRRPTVDEALSMARQIAQGLEAAHDKGIVHRDLKPANVRVSPDGTVKLLDFGLARAWEEHDPADPTNSPTITSGVTGTGVIMGTAAYMSPEQARGKPVDRQADVWAFGCVLYEMLAGRSAFAGETITDTLAAIIHKDPDWQALPANVPSHVRRLLQLCLQKAPTDRLRDARDIRLMLNAPADDDAAGAGVAPSQGGGSASMLWPVIAGVLAVALVLSLVLADFGGSKTGTDASTATDVEVPQVGGLVQLTDRLGSEADPSLSHDGRTFLFRARDGGDSDIFLQRVGGEKPINLTADHAGDDLQPAFSPDGQRIAFASSRQGGGIFVMGATGETPLRLVDFGFDPAWSPDGQSLVICEEMVTFPSSRTSMSNLWIVDVTSHAKRNLGVEDGVGPSWSPNNKRIAYWTHHTSVRGQRDIFTVPVEGGQRVAVTDDAAMDWDPVWSPDGRWLYFLSDRGGSPDVWRVRIEETTGEPLGTPQPITLGTTGVMQLSLSQSGRMAFNSTTARSDILAMGFDAAALRPTGTSRRIHSSNQVLIQLDVSADAEWLTYRTTAKKEYVYLLSTDGAVRRRLVATDDRNRGPRFVPDSDWMLFYSNRSLRYEIWAIKRDGTGLKQLTHHDDWDYTNPRITPDGGIIATYDAPNGSVLAELRIPEGGIEAMQEPIAMSPLHEAFSLNMGMMSPDGRYLTGAEVSTSLISIHDLQTQQAFAVEIDGQTVRDISWPGWLDNTRILMWLAREQVLVVHDVETKETTRVPGVPGPASYHYRPATGELLFTHIQTDSQLWMIDVQ